MKKLFCGFLVLMLASSADAHGGVQNKYVKVRMQAMKDLATSMKAFGAVSKGKRSFDRSETREIAKQVAYVANQIPALFRAEETDPESKAKPDIWFDYQDFSEKARGLERVALKFSKTIFERRDVGLAMREIGKTCKACHQAYKD